MDFDSLITFSLLFLSLKHAFSYCVDILCIWVSSLPLYYELLEGEVYIGGLDVFPMEPSRHNI